MFKQILNISLLSLAVSLPLSALLYAQESAQKDTAVQNRTNIVQEDDDTTPHIQVAICLTQAHRCLASSIKQEPRYGLLSTH